MTAPAPTGASRMARRLTEPYARGADTLELSLTRFSSSQATVESYDFADHTARFDAPPQPRYSLATTRDIATGITMTVSYHEPGAPSVDLQFLVPAGTVAGTSFLLAEPVTATARITLLTMGTSPFDNNPDRCWTLTALLGNTAKLLWVIGGERDQLRNRLVRTAAQRHLPDAAGLSLDLIGADLGVPRFPPLPYGFDADTVALYHLDDAAVTDQTSAYPGRTGHPGTLIGPVRTGLPGRYGRAMGIPDGRAWIDIAAGPEFDIAGDGNATVECFVRPDPSATDGPVLSRNADAGDDSPGWALAIGKFGRGVAHNVRFRIGDGDRTVDLFADRGLPTDAFTHVAGVVDRIAGVVALYLDGIRVDWRPVFPLNTVAPAAPVRIGAPDGGFRGAVDEVRISSAARSGFAPALGESDEHYRRRLDLFRRWTLPTPANLTALLNRLVGPVGTDPETGRDALVVDDTNARLVRGTRLVRVRPVALVPGESMDAAGRRNVTEASVVGTAADEDAFDPAYLFFYDRPDVDFTPAPFRALAHGEHAPDTHLIQVGLADRLDRLVALAGAETVPPGRLLVDSAYDPRAADLRATGRAVLLGHGSVPPGRLAALAQRAGFDYVTYRAATGQVYAAVAQGDYFAIDLASASLDAGATAGLSLRPAPPADAFLRWLIVPGGAGQGTVTPEGVRGRTASLRADAAGPLAVKVDVERDLHTVSATRTLRVGLAGLPDGATIDEDGTPGAAISSVERPDTFFDEVFLVSHSDPRADYGSAAAHRMQPALAELLDALLAELTRRTVGGRLTVAAAFDPAGEPAAAQGRRLVLRHSVLAPGPLASAAFAVGLGHLRRAGNDLEVRRPPGQLVVVRGPAGIEKGPVIELDEGAATDLTAAPAREAIVAAGLPGQGPDGAPRLGWSSGRFDTAVISLGSSTRQTVTLRAGSAGMAWVQAGYLVGGEPVPYTFRVRLRPDLDHPDTVLTKDQFDLIMNVLNALHPVGVEVDTSAIRAHVIELRDGVLQSLNPDYTYPKFRVRGTLPPQARRPVDD